MMPEKMNTIHHRDFLLNDLPDKCADLIIADPPYFQVKGAFDFIWPAFEDYLKDVEDWAKECTRVLSDKGTLFWWGDADKIAYTQIILDKYLKLSGNLVWEKNECQTMRSEVKMLRSFAPVTERLLMYDRGNDKSGLECVLDDPDLFKGLKSYFDSWLKSSGLSLKNAVEAIGSSSSHWLGFTRNPNKTQFILPTLEKWEIMKGLYSEIRDYDDLKGEWDQKNEEYEPKRLEYEARRRRFDLPFIMGDVLHYSQESHITKKYDHETKKPELLTRMLINVSTRRGDLVVVPFAGSGTECAMAAKEGRAFIGYDIKKEYTEMANRRSEYHLKRPTLF